VLAAACCWLFRRTDKVHVLMLVGVLGNAVITLGWFGASLGTKHHVGIVPNLSAVAVLVAIQIGVGCAALTPAGCLRSRRA
jgi:hypothetical protein